MNQQLRIATEASDRFQFPDRPQLREIFAFIEANYDRSIGLNEVAKTFKYTPAYLTSLVRKLTGKTLYQWIVERRMFQGRLLLLTSNLSVNQIALEVGYLDPGHFIKHFKKIHDRPPLLWRNDRLKKIRRKSAIG